MTLRQKTIINEEITIENPQKAITKWCEENLVVDNPDYYTRLRLGKYIGNTNPKMDLYRKNGNKLIIPFGCLEFVANIILDGDYNLDFADKKFNYNTEIPLYDYQEEAVEKMVKAKEGILQSATGSGKTQMGLAIICKLGYKALWITHTQDLLKQSYDRAAQYIDKKYLGTITNGKVNIGEGITFATVQTLAKIDLSKIRKEFRTVVVDECHRVAGSVNKATQFSKVLNSLAARHKYGLSATVHRADGLIKCCYALLGPIKFSVDSNKIANKIMPVRILKRELETDSNISYLDTDGTLIYNKLIDYLCKNEERNEIIANDLRSNEENYNLILSDRIEHLEILKTMLNTEKSALITGKSKKGDREKALEDARIGKINYLFATYSLAKEGLDIPCLNRLYLTTPQSDYAIITQAVGRIARACEGKKEPVAYDYTDINIKHLERKWKKRYTSYKKCNCILR